MYLSYHESTGLTHVLKYPTCPKPFTYIGTFTTNGESWWYRSFHGDWLSINKRDLPKHLMVSALIQGIAL